ncbi:cation:proton antiporter [Flavobacterium salilacus subsp. salilacus]|uniref:cation:proton antiporter n=1 Tax=Flavobacterium TaxID=237 RepID=UPI001074D5B6|nr:MULTISPECIES: cation:proton antiporter [Flavobacterium]KAF2518142.1 cation:proton antiporter [Flavobacterium salilacus subsp. salilacus]MBE1615548.1 cation:proton antiporter [Flavobacterium sp. SaA2.13]
MHQPQFELPFFTNLLILLVTARIFGEIFERFKQPAMIGEITAGIVLGPSVFNLIHRTEDLEVISELGIFLLVIIAGLEINIDDILKSLKGKNILISLMAFFVPIFGGIAVGYLFEQDIMTSVFIGLCIAITALPVSIRILMDLGKINSEVGQKIISIAIFDDVLALSILGVLLNIQDTDMSLTSIVKASAVSILKLIIFISLLSVAYLLIKKVLRKGNYIQESLDKLVSLLKSKESLFALFFAFVLLFSTVTENLGLHFIVGAFFAALLISDSLIGKNNLKAIETTTSSIAMGFLAPIFFAGIGLEFNVFSISNIGLLVTVIAVSYLSKIAGGYFGGTLAGLSRQVSFTLGIGLNARGIMELVIANIAYRNGLISTEIFSVLVIMGVLTTLTTPLLLKRAFGRME